MNVKEQTITYINKELVPAILQFVNPNEFIVGIGGSLAYEFADIHSAVDVFVF